MITHLKIPNHNQLNNSMIKFKNHGFPILQFHVFRAYFKCFPLLFLEGYKGKMGHVFEKGFYHDEKDVAIISIYSPTSCFFFRFLTVYFAVCRDGLGPCGGSFILPSRLPLVSPFSSGR
jgi:hypothetical protein